MVSIKVKIGNLFQKKLHLNVKNKLFGCYGRVYNILYNGFFIKIGNNFYIKFVPNELGYKLKDFLITNDLKYKDIEGYIKVNN